MRAEGAVKDRYEVHHGVRISDAALVAAATYSQRYITDRFLPDKVVEGAQTPVAWRGRASCPRSNDSHGMGRAHLVDPGRRRST